MTGNAIVLSDEERRIVDAVIVRHCQIRKWTLHARNVRTTHVHAIMTAMVDGNVVRAQLKAWASRRWSEHAGLERHGKDGLQRWWTDCGGIMCIDTEEQLGDAILYVTEFQ
jgi:REP element-mobilizing transposase RayT